MSPLQPNDNPILKFWSHNEVSINAKLCKFLAKLEHGIPSPSFKSSSGGIRRPEFSAKYGIRPKLRVSPKINPNNNNLSVTEVPDAGKLKLPEGQIQVFSGDSDATARKIHFLEPRDNEPLLSLLARSTQQNSA